ncbi:cytochrome P450 [Rhizocola hellebori]|uniref:Cytochrome P450 n=1 Tax=Rhizocola hellebori TaxID=1392758 RepID=A0A8J3QCL6_9ACTN|nr:cytochrome P450 [Rhizocola hellebori]GIH07562.1 cytochrome P450 [Rhizocola hellebori]
MRTGVVRKARMPRRLPLLGHAVSFARDPLAFISTMRHAGDVVKIRVGTQDLYLIYKPALVRQVLTDATTFVRGIQAERTKVLLGNGLVSSDGDFHLRNRRLVQPAFHRQRIAGYADVMREEAEAMVARWREGGQIAADDEVMQVGLRVVGKTLFSNAFGVEAVDEVVRSVPLVLDGVGRRALDPTGLLQKLPTAGNREFNTTLQRLRDVVDRIIAEYRASNTDHGDMVSMLLRATDAETGEQLTDLQIRDEVITMLAAGTDTTANTLSWILHVLGERADLEARLHAEVDSVVGDRPVTLADVPKLEFVRRLISEALRLYPQAWVLARTTTVPVRLGDTALPAGTSMLLPIYALQRDPAVFPDPTTFDPDRWDPERTNQAMKPSFLPFGAGRHQCVGEAFAWTEAAITLAVIARHWRLCPVPGKSVEINSLATLRPTQLPMTTHLRNTV